METRLAERRDEDLLTARQAGVELPMSVGWFNRRRMAGEGPPFVRVSGRIFYRRGDLRAWIAAQPRGGEQPQVRVRNGGPQPAWPSQAEAA